MRNFLIMSLLKFFNFFYIGKSEKIAIFQKWARVGFWKVAFLTSLKPYLEPWRKLSMGRRTFLLNLECIPCGRQGFYFGIRIHDLCDPKRVDPTRSGSATLSWDSQEYMISIILYSIYPIPLLRFIVLYVHTVYNSGQTVRWELEAERQGVLENKISGYRFQVDR